MPDEVPTHTQKSTIHFIEYYPPHPPRTNDPHYKYFNAAKRRLIKLGAMKCWIGNSDCGGPLEIHHSLVEFSLQNGVDISRFIELYPEFDIKNDEDFLKWMEGEGNLLVLCLNHHRGKFGIHGLPYPNWIVQRFWKKELPSPVKEL